MRRIDNIDIKIEEKTVVIIGKFDGFHRGHTLLLDAAARMRRPGESILVFTFRSPENDPGNDLRWLLTRGERAARAEELGVDILVECPFTDEVRTTTAMDFLKKILIERLNMRAAVAGDDCTFGYRGAGNAAFLKEHAEELGYEVSIEGKVKYLGEDISSTRIRDCVSAGNMTDAAEMLGYHYSVCGEVEHGRRLGHGLGFPTANITIPKRKLAPKNGVYASQVTLDGIVYDGMTDVGTRPTVTDSSDTGIETFIFDFDGDIYGRMIKVELIDRIRDEKTFGSLDELKIQLEQDEKRCRSILQT